MQRMKLSYYVAKTKNPHRFLLSVKIYAFISIAFVLGAISISSLYLYIDYSQAKTRHSLLVNEAQALDNILNNILIETRQMLTYVGKQIRTYSANDPILIEKTLKSAVGIAATTKNNYSWTLFDWVDPLNPTIIINSQLGAIKNPYLAYYPPYTNKCRQSPWALNLFQPHVGNTSGMWVINAALGVTDKKEQYLGMVFVGLNIATLNASIEKMLALGVHFIILDQNLKIILQSTHNAINPKSTYYRDHYRDFLPKEAFLKGSHGSLERPIRYKDIMYTVCKKTTSYPYIILVGYDDTYIHNEIWGLFLPRLYEFLIVGSVCLSFFLLRRKMRTVMKASEREKDTLRHRTNLEMRKSLVSALSYSNLLRMHFRGETAISREQQKKISEDIYQSICELCATENNALNFTYNNINNIIENAICMHAAELIHRNIQVKTDLLSTLPPFYGDEFRLKQALIALIALSMNYSPNGSTIIITTCEKYENGTRKIVVIIEDDGFALTTDDMSRLAEDFSDGVSPATAQLGFSEIERIVHLHYGTCDLESSQTPGKKFIISLLCRTKEEIDSPASMPSDNVYWLFKKNSTLQ